VTAEDFRNYWIGDHFEMQRPNLSNCYNVAGNVIPCPSPGQDLYGQDDTVSTRHSIPGRTATPQATAGMPVLREMGGKVKEKIGNWPAELFIRCGYRIILIDFK
jgi:hypothetical protein